MLLVGTPILAHAQISTTSTTAVRIGPEAVVARLLSFDVNGDGTLEAGELAERMHGLMAYGDFDGSGVLEPHEIIRLANSPRSVQVGSSPSILDLVPGLANAEVLARSGRYGFRGNDTLSSRLHIQGALEDLRLASEVRDRALPVVNEFVAAQQAAARASIVSEMENALTEQQMRDLKAAMDAPSPPPPASASLAVPLTAANLRGTCPGAGVFCNSSVPVFGLAEPMGSALERFKARLRPNDAERSVLLAQLRGILDDEQLDNFRAALERRPVVDLRAGAGPR
jgi:hypothetical protein